MKKTTIRLLAITLTLSALTLTACNEKGELTDNNDSKPSTTQNKSADDSKATDPTAKTYPWTVHPETACTVNGTDFSFPTVTAQEMCDLLGLKPDDNVFNDYSAIDDRGFFAIDAYKGEHRIEITVRNLTDENKRLMPLDCHVISVAADKEHSGDMDVRIRGIGLGSTEAEMIAAFSEFGKDEFSSLEKESYDADDGEKAYVEYYYEIINPKYFYGHSYQFEITDGIVTYAELSEGGGVTNYNN